MPKFAIAGDETEFDAYTSGSAPNGFVSPQRMDAMPSVP